MSANTDNATDQTPEDSTVSAFMKKYKTQLILLCIVILCCCFLLLIYMTKKDVPHPQMMYPQAMYQPSPQVVYQQPSYQPPPVYQAPQIASQLPMANIQSIAR